MVDIDSNLGQFESKQNPTFRNLGTSENSIGRISTSKNIQWIGNTPAQHVFLEVIYNSFIISISQCPFLRQNQLQRLNLRVTTEEGKTLREQKTFRNTHAVFSIKHVTMDLSRSSEFVTL